MLRRLQIPHFLFYFTIHIPHIQWNAMATRRFRSCLAARPYMSHFRSRSHYPRSSISTVDCRKQRTKLSKHLAIFHEINATGQLLSPLYPSLWEPHNTLSKLLSILVPRSWDPLHCVTISTHERSSQKFSLSPTYPPFISILSRKISEKNGPLLLTPRMYDRIGPFSTRTCRQRTFT